MLNPRIHHHAALDTTYSLDSNIAFVSLLSPDSAKHPTCFQEADRVLWPFTSVIGTTCACSLQASADLPRVALVDTLPFRCYTQHVNEVHSNSFLQPFIRDGLQAVGFVRRRGVDSRTPVC